MLKNQKLLFIGVGTMGKALIKGVIDSGNKTEIKAIEKNIQTLDKIKNELNIDIYSNQAVESPVKDADIVIICVKPQDVKTSINSLKSYLKPDSLIISIAAGISTSYIEEILDKPNPVIRAMPNTPCLIREGITVVSRGTHAQDNHISIAKELFSNVGECMELDEKHMNAVTGLSGSGPAFIYLIIEALSDGGVMEGIPRKTATKLAAHTLLGASKMVLQTGKHPAELKDDVSTPAGCTIGAILSLEDGRIRSVLARAVQEASKIASSLGS